MLVLELAAEARAAGIASNAVYYDQNDKRGKAGFGGYHNMTAVRVGVGAPFKRTGPSEARLLSKDVTAPPSRSKVRLYRLDGITLSLWTVTTNHEK